MNTLSKASLVLILLAASVVSAQKTIEVKSFNKVIVSPHISVTFVKGASESIEIKKLKIDESKLNIEQHRDAIHIYLEGAKTTTKSKKVDYENYSGRDPIYKGTIAELIVTYTSLVDLSLRGEEAFFIKGEVATSDFDLTIYGESHVIFDQVKIDEMKSTLYGESTVLIKDGHIGYHKIVSYGESELDLLKTSTESAKVVAYGEARIKLNVSDELKVTSYGEATIAYAGNPEVSKGIVIGDVDIYRIRD